MAVLRKMAGQDMLLYWISGSVPCWRPMIVLEEKLLSGYKSVRIKDTSNKDHKSDMLKINPRGQVPTFKFKDIAINESKAICYYLESQFKTQGTQLIPDDPGKQALVLQRMFEADNIHVNGIRKIFWYHVRVKKEDIDGNVLLEKYKVLSKELEYWEKYLTTEYICGNEFTMADIYLFTYLAVLIRGSLPLEDRPNIKRYYEKLSQRPSIMTSWPPHFKETPPTQIYAGVKTQF